MQLSSDGELWRVQHCRQVGDWAFARSQMTGTVTSRTDGDIIPVDVKQLIIYHRQLDGRWKIARHINNGNS